MMSPALRQILPTPIPCGKVIPAFRGAAVATFRALGHHKRANCRHLPASAQRWGGFLFFWPFIRC